MSVDNCPNYRKCENPNPLLSSQVLCLALILFWNSEARDCTVPDTLHLLPAWVLLYHFKAENCGSEWGISHKSWTGTCLKCLIHSTRYYSVLYTISAIFTADSYCRNYWNQYAQALSCTVGTALDSKLYVICMRRAPWESQYESITCIIRADSSDLEWVISKPTVPPGMTHYWWVSPITFSVVWLARYQQCYDWSWECFACGAASFASCILCRVCLCLPLVHLYHAMIHVNFREAIECFVNILSPAIGFLL